MLRSSIARLPRGRRGDHKSGLCPNLLSSVTYDRNHRAGERHFIRVLDYSSHNDNWYHRSRGALTYKPQYMKRQLHLFGLNQVPVCLPHVSTAPTRLDRKDNSVLTYIQNFAADSVAKRSKLGTQSRVLNVTTGKIIGGTSFVLTGAKCNERHEPEGFT